MRNSVKFLAGMTAALAGMLLLVSCPGNGAVALQIQDFNYTPPSPVHIGDTLTFTALIPEGENVSVVGFAGAPGGNSVEIPMHDDGVTPDEAADDRIYSGALLWLAEYGTGKMTISILASGTLQGSNAESKRKGPQLEVLP
jgi:hypothetical protein